jgi:ATP-binding cassette subfamily A (ABC1) protein 3
MDEADYLGDRIGIMGEGKMVCCGSGIYLKNRFGVGYNLTFVKESSSSDSNGIISLARKHVPNVVVLSNVATDLSLQLPMDSVKNFPSMFD